MNIKTNYTLLLLKMHKRSDKNVRSKTTQLTQQYSLADPP